ncbi:MAG: hypothetical protein COB22_06725 [Cycloclasticus sp.]|nr:MAG: hypothetical protein COB22_06725 [Cycloclasticus sp.]
MNELPEHGRISCTRCYQGQEVIFDNTKQTDGNWRITSNPLAWGNSNAEIVVLGFSKGPTQAGDLENTPHDQIAYKGSRLNVGKILAHIGLLPKADNASLKLAVDNEISNKSSRFHFGSLIRCTVEQFDEKKNKWKGSGGGMLDKFVRTEFGQTVTNNCVSNFLVKLPEKTKIIIMFGMGSKQNYVKESFKLFNKSRPSEWRWVNDVTYTDGSITVVHVEHFASQGALIPNWLGENQHERSRLGEMAKEGVATALGNNV